MFCYRYYLITLWTAHATLTRNKVISILEYNCTEEPVRRWRRRRRGGGRGRGKGGGRRIRRIPETEKVWRGKEGRKEGGRREMNSN